MSRLSEMFVILSVIKQAGIIEEMLEDTMEGLEDSEELEEAAQEEVDKVVLDLNFTMYK